MRGRTRLVAALVTAGVVGAAAVAVPAAGVGPFAPVAAAATADGQGPGGPPHGTAGDGGQSGGRQGGGGHPSGGPGAGGQRTGGQDGTAGGGGAAHDPAPSGTLTDQQRTALAAMAEEEKLAGDLYEAFAQRYPAAVFGRIAASEDQHLASVRAVLDRYDVPDPTAGRPAGTFATASVQQLYDTLLATGSTGQDGALAAGRQVEQTDIADLQRASGGLTAPDVVQLYQHLLEASTRHLSAFSG